MKIYLTVIVKAKPEYQQEISNLLYRLPEQSKKEAACIEYEVHQSMDDETTYILNEEWESLFQSIFHRFPQITGTAHYLQVQVIA